MKYAIIFNGTLGAGKSAVADELYQLVNSCIRLEGDELLYIRPHYKSDDERNGHMVSLLPSIINYWKDKNIEFFILSHLMSTTEQIYKIEKVFQNERVTPVVITLWADTKVIHNRILERNNKGKPEFELKPSDRVLKELSCQSYLGRAINTENVAPADLAKLVYKHLNKIRLPSEEDVAINILSTSDVKSILSWYTTPAGNKVKALEELPDLHPFRDSFKHTFYSRSIRYKGKVVGFIALPKMSDFEINFGFSIAPDYQGKGIGSKAALLASKELNLEFPNFQVTAGTEKSNIPAKKILEKSGFQLIKVEKGGQGFGEEKEVARYKLINAQGL